ncbi:hypothetical protein [Actinokineospora enzanensis]|uniref:hypothetical protein n=1 Tax=Actinokineospora enzanensis TaxID=155975 RepID=UPI000364F866|nr:hypothetical protein [Actinokineospora enzanensis]
MSLRDGKGGVLAVVAGLLAFAVSPAHAEVAADSSGSVGGGQARFGTTAVDIGPLAPCAAGGPGIGTTPGASDGPISFGSGKSTCVFDPLTEQVSATVLGSDFAVKAKVDTTDLPELSIGDYKVTCYTTAEGGVTSSVSLKNVTGVKLPDPIPEDYTVLVPGFFPDDPPIAKIVFNETVEADPPDGSLTVHAVKIWFYPDTDPNGPPAPNSGAITVGSVTCTPSHH